MARTKGAKNKKTIRLEHLAANGIDPLAWMLKVLRDPKAKGDRRDKMAALAAPYLHARKQQVDIQGGVRITAPDPDAELISGKVKALIEAAKLLIADIRNRQHPHTCVGYDCAECTPLYGDLEKLLDELDASGNPN